MAGTPKGTNLDDKINRSGAGAYNAGQTTIDWAEDHNDLAASVNFLFNQIGSGTLVGTSGNFLIGDGDKYIEQTSSQAKTALGLSAVQNIAMDDHVASGSAHHSPTVAGDINHNDVANLNAGDSYEHITQTQKNGLHTSHSYFTSGDAVDAIEGVANAAIATGDSVIFKDVTDGVLKQDLVSDLLALGGGDVDTSLIFDTNDFLPASGDTPAWIQHSTVNNNAMDANNYVKMINATDWQMKKSAGSNVNHSWWFRIPHTIMGGGIRVTWDWKRLGTWWNATTSYYLTPYFFQKSTGVFSIGGNAAAFRTSTGLYNWAWYNGSAYVGVGITPVSTSWQTLELEMTFQAAEFDANNIAFRARTDGGSWSYWSARSDTYTQLDDEVYGLLGFLAHNGASGAFWDLVFRNMKVEQLADAWMSP